MDFEAQTSLGVTRARDVQERWSALAIEAARDCLGDNGRL